MSKENVNSSDRPEDPKELSPGKINVFSGSQVEKFLLKLASNDKLGKKFLEDREKVIENLKIPLSEQDKLLLKSVPQNTLGNMIEKFASQRSSRRKFLKGAAASIAFLATGSLLSSYGCMAGIEPEDYTMCQENLFFIGKALDAYAKKHDGTYPPSLDVLKKEGYIENIKCYTSGKKYSYTCNKECNDYTLWCSEPDTHRLGAGQEGCWPQYSPSNGLLLPGYNERSLHTTRRIRPD